MNQPTSQPVNQHQPVLLREVLDILLPAGRKVLVDCTVGLGGHSEALLEAAGPEAVLIGTDVDERNLRAARERLARFGQRARLFAANFAQLPDVLALAEVETVDVLLADLGIASNQLADPTIGLSFAQDAPLDMRLDKRVDQTAADIVNTMDERRLADLIFAYGEERYSRRIAKAIVVSRRLARVESTAQLAEIVVGAVPAAVRHSRYGVHPATRTFQALRIAVNDELGSLDRLLDMLPETLAVGGRAAIISFHSLEDGRVKRAFAEWTAKGTAELLAKKPITPEEQEIHGNPRSRSAKLRAVQRVA